MMQGVSGGEEMEMEPASEQVGLDVLLFSCRSLLMTVVGVPQRRLRHLTEVLVRNLTIPAFVASGSAPGASTLSPTLERASSSASTGARAAAPSAGPSTRGARLQMLRAERPPYLQRRSKDDLDLPVASSQRHSTLGRRKNTVSRVRDLSASLEELPNASDHLPLPSPVEVKHDVKGKGREGAAEGMLSNGSEGPSEMLARSRLQDPVAIAILEDTDLVYGWTAAEPRSDTLQRSRSKSSLKSQSSKRSIAGVSKRLFQHNRRRKGAPAGSDDEELDDTSDSDHARRPSTSREHSSNMSGQHVSFQMSTDGWTTQGLGLGSTVEGQLESAKRRARSASRSSILSVASGSSTSTIRAPPPKPSEKEERYLCQKRYEGIRSHLVRSRLVLALPYDSADHPGSTIKRPQLSRTRTISLPLGNQTALSLDLVQSGSIDRNVPYKTLYISPPHKKSMEPAFPLDVSHTGPACRRHRFIAQVWVENAESQSAKEASKPPQTSWKLLLEWEVDLRKLVSLGTDVSGS